jgi:hypothetical protein
MKSLRIYNILTEDGQTIDDVVLQVPIDFDSWEMIFSMVLEKTGIDVDSYSYEEI